jgi:phosphoribosyl-ATP pyrophosphohydrolase
MFLNDLFEIIQDRKQNRPDGSYTVQLLDQGSQAILRKVGEEAVEILLAAQDEGEERLVEEIADLVYHTLVLLAAHQIPLTAVEDELRRRHLREPG